MLPSSLLPFGAFWNFFLLALPFLLTLFLEKKFRNQKWNQVPLPKKILFLLLFPILILLLPNIPYIFTDIRHVLSYCERGDAYNRCFQTPWIIPFLFGYACIAIPIFVITIRKIALLLGSMFHPLLKTLAPLGLIPLAALGVLVGLFERLNSWDAILHFEKTVAIALGYFYIPEKIFALMAFSLCFFGIFYFFRFFFAENEK